MASKLKLVTNLETQFRREKEKMKTTTTTTTAIFTELF